MDIQYHFEPLYKMNRLGPVSTSVLPLPVKFRSVIYDPSLEEEETTNTDQETDQDSDLSDTELSLPAESSGKLFFKDPLRLPDCFKSENNDSSALKLGKNMRSSTGLTEKDDHKKIFQFMKEGNRLLNLQKEQQILHRRQVASEQMAAVLVNDLLRNGFQITPPDSTPRSHDDSWKSPTSKIMPSVDEDSLQSIVGGNQLIVAMHKELKKLQINDTNNS